MKRHHSAWQRTRTRTRAVPTAPRGLLRRDWAAAVLLGLLAALPVKAATGEPLPPSSAPPGSGPQPVTEVAPAGLVLEGMTFVSSEGSDAEMVVEADHARLDRDTNLVILDRVRTEVHGEPERSGFEMTCDEGELDVDTRKLLATGNVHGRTVDGREFLTTWVRYDPAEDLAYTDAPVLIYDAGGSFQGGGFRYHVRENRFRLLGGASVVREGE